MKESEKGRDSGPSCVYYCWPVKDPVISVQQNLRAYAQYVSLALKMTELSIVRHFLIKDRGPKEDRFRTLPRDFGQHKWGLNVLFCISLPTFCDLPVFFYQSRTGRKTRKLCTRVVLQSMLSQKISRLKGETT